MSTHTRNLSELLSYRDRINYERQRAYAEQNNWILFPEDYPAPNHARQLGVEAMISMEKAPVFDELNRNHWKKYFAQFELFELKNHALALGMYPPKNRGAIVARLCIHYRKAVGA